MTAAGADGETREQLAEGAGEVSARQLLALILDELDELMSPHRVGGVVVTVNGEQWRAGVRWAHTVIACIAGEQGLIPPPIEGAA